MGGAGGAAHFGLHGGVAVEAARLGLPYLGELPLNLDGGGSTTMTVRGEVVNRPSDPGGERRVSNGVFALP